MPCTCVCTEHAVSDAIDFTWNGLSSRITSSLEDDDTHLALVVVTETKSLACLSRNLITCQPHDANGLSLTVLCVGNLAVSAAQV